MTHRLEGTPLLEELRGLVSADVRAYVHGIAPTLVAALAAFGLLGANTGGLIAAAVIAVIDLLFALLHSSNTWRSALYTFAAAMQPVGITVGLGTDSQWVTGLAVLAALLGSGVAAAKTPVLRL